MLHARPPRLLHLTRLEFVVVEFNDIICKCVFHRFDNF